MNMFAGFATWVCLKIGYIPNYSHLIGIMISKTIGFRGTLFSDTPTCCLVREFDIWIIAENKCEEPGPVETGELQGQTEAKAGELEQAAKIPET